MNPESFLKKLSGCIISTKKREKKYYAAMIKYINLLGDGYNA